MNTQRFSRSAIAVAGLLSMSGLSLATQPIPFDPDGSGTAHGTIMVKTFDWMPGSAIAVEGNPSGGLQVTNVVHLLSHGKLGSMILTDNSLRLAPTGTEFTFVTGFAEKVDYADGTNLILSFDPTQTTLPNFFEMWADAPADSTPLAGTGYNNGKRILYGMITSAGGNYSGGAPIQALDQFLTNNYPAINTIAGSGSTRLTGVVIAADADYFPGLTPAMLNDFKVFFNTSSVTPYREVDPSGNFVGDYAGWDGNSPPPANVAMNVGAVNGGPQVGQTLNFILQADANQAFDLGEEIPGTCRVTYGGNDKNGNIAQGSFGQICAKVKGKESCYTFGGQVGAPTANPALGGPFGEHTHHQVSGDAGDFVFRAGTRSALKTTRITATACKDPGAIQPAAANASFKQIDFEGTGSFRTLSSTAKSYLVANGGPTDIAPDNASDKIYYFRVDMVDAGEPGNKGKKPEVSKCAAFLDADQNATLATADPLLLDYVAGGGSCADVYQFYICPSELPCEQNQAMYAVRGFLSGGNIQMHKVVK